MLGCVCADNMSRALNAAHVCLGPLGKDQSNSRGLHGLDGGQVDHSPSVIFCPHQDELQSP